MSKLTANEFNATHNTGNLVTIVDDSGKSHSVKVVKKAWSLVDGRGVEVFFRAELSSGREMVLLASRIA